MRPGKPTPKKGKRRRGGAAVKAPPGPLPRQGVNSHKQAQARRRQQQAHRTGALRRFLQAVRSVTLSIFVMGLLGAGGWAGYRAFEDNGLLVLRQVDVVGNRSLLKAQILAKAGLELGTKLPMAPVMKAESALRSLPGVNRVKVRRVFPSRIEIEVEEKAPVAMGYAKGWQGLASDGSRLPVIAREDSDLPVVDRFASLDSLERVRLGAFLEEARRNQPSLYGDFSQIALRKGGDLEIILRGGKLKVQIATGIKSLNSLEFLKELMSQQGPALESGKTIDMRVEGYAYVR